MRAMLLAGILLLAIATLDVLTRVQLRIPQFYLIPVVLIAWRVGLRASIATAILAAIIVFFSSIQAGNHNARAFLFYAEQLATLTFFIAAGVLAARLREIQDQTAEFVRRDQLTGIANRMALMERLKLELARHRRTSQSFALVFIDCDNFKEINDRRGHLEGDHFLQIVAATLQGAMRMTDLVSRLSGDEFIVLLPDTDPCGAQCVADTLEVRLREETIRTGWSMTFSIGVAVFPTPPANPDIAIQHADNLMYMAKQAGKGRSILEVFEV
uniref:GGDEF protein n=1 Tax=Dechloromonas aromatica (strain RCB) TaxID=159087 RepID=Q47DQ1_DECAR